MSIPSKIQQARRVADRYGLRVFKVRGQNPDAFYIGSKHNKNWRLGSPDQPLTLFKVETCLGINSSPLTASRSNFMLKCEVDEKYFRQNFHHMMDRDEALRSIIDENNVPPSSVHDWYNDLSYTDLPTWAEYHHWPSAVFIYPEIIKGFLKVARHRKIDAEFQQQVFDHFIMNNINAGEVEFEWVEAINNAQLARHT